VLLRAPDCKPPRVRPRTLSVSRAVKLYSARFIIPNFNPPGRRPEPPKRMRLFKICLVLLASVAFYAACNNTQTATNANANASRATASPASSPAPAATPDELASAGADYSQFCIKCHKADGTGGTIEMDEGKPMKVPSLREHGKKDPDEHLAKQIREGGDEMPPFKKKLDDQRINNLVRYIRREFHGQTAAGAGTAQPAH
jgi:mono/diheme cytochrome c family protein